MRKEDDVCVRSHMSINTVVISAANCGAAAFTSSLERQNSQLTFQDNVLTSY